MSGVVEFDVAQFRESYPNLASTDAQLEDYFAIAETFLLNTECSVVKDLSTRRRMLYLLTAHIATLNSNAENGQPIVGRVSSATEGSVSVSIDYGTMGNNERWYLQTPYGAMYWQMTKRFRSALYRLGKKPMPVSRRYSP